MSAVGKVASLDNQRKGTLSISFWTTLINDQNYLNFTGMIRSSATETDWNDGSEVRLCFEMDEAANIFTKRKNRIIFYATVDSTQKLKGFEEQRFVTIAGQETSLDEWDGFCYRARNNDILE